MNPSSTPARAAALASLLCLCLAHASAAAAQSPRQAPSRAKLTRGKAAGRDSCPAVGGTVYDINRAVVAGARVRLTWDEGRKELTALTDEEGRFLVGALEPAAYVLTVESNGFATLKQGGLKLAAGEVVTLDVTLEAAVYVSRFVPPPALR